MMCNVAPARKSFLRGKLEGAFGLLLFGATEIISKWAYEVLDKTCVDRSVVTGSDLNRRVVLSRHDGLFAPKGFCW